MFVQGSEGFAGQMEKLLDGSAIGGLFMTTPYSASANFEGAGHKRYKVTHRQFGGV